MPREIDHIIIHCSASQAKTNLTAADIDRMHRARGWLGNGYHYVIRRDGTVESKASGARCRSMDRAGAHVGDCGPGWNKRSIGICMVGGVNADLQPEDNFTAEQYDALEDLLEVLLTELPDVTIMGHRDLIKLTGAPPKACPSFDVQDWMATRGFRV